MCLIYPGSISSPTVGIIGNNGNLKSLAVRSAITFVIYGFIILLIPWPRFVTYIAALWTLRAMADTTLAFNGRGIHALTLASRTLEGRRHYMISQTIAFFNRALLTVSAYFLGY